MTCRITFTQNSISKLIFTVFLGAKKGEHDVFSLFLLVPFKIAIVHSFIIFAIAYQQPKNSARF